MSLQEAVREHGPWPAPSVLALGAALAEALLSIHRAGIVHRDLKPSNVMLSADGPRVIDFGIARAADAAAITRTGAVLGTPGYLPPEQALGAEVGPAGDVFALGAVLVFTATGNGPFGAGPMVEMLRRVVHEPPRLDGVADPRLREVAAACLRKDPAARPTPADLLRELGGGGVPRPPDAVLAQIEHQAALPLPGRGIRRRALVAGAVSGVLAVTAGTAWAVGRSGSRPDPAASAAGPAPPSPIGRPGRLLWQHDAGRPLRVAPAVVSGRVVAGDDGGRLHAVNASDGSAAWRYPASDRPVTAVAAAGSTVVAGCQDGTVHAVDVRSGRRIWRRELGRSTFSVLVSGRTVYAAAGTEGLSGVVVALSLADGTPRWRHETTTAVSGPFGVAGGLVVVPDETLYALDARSGSVRWRSDVDLPVGAAAAGPVVYSTTEAPALHARDPATGEHRWTYEPDDEIVAPVTRHGSAAYAADRTGTVYALADDGRRLWRTQLSGEVHGAVAGDGRRLFAGAGDGRVYGLDLAGGSIVWTYQTRAAVTASPIPAGRSLFVASTDGYLYALDAGA
ncbi:outer membrane protein assembly factor BamB family protein [Thermomonospora amylolytica]|uniref:serine/threonine-protein kinase n=1 Tax=Thermomonospora amylolytica TaxID=1411117 RepID=UPI001F314AE8|nr:serine/threonine-protein kinase [Thermomonospora amylolytica]